MKIQSMLVEKDLIIHLLPHGSTYLARVTCNYQNAQMGAKQTGKM